MVIRVNHDGGTKGRQPKNKPIPPAPIVPPIPNEAVLTITYVALRATQSCILSSSQDSQLSGSLNLVNSGRVYVVAVTLVFDSSQKSQQQKSILQLVSGTVLVNGVSAVLEKQPIAELRSSLSNSWDINIPELGLLRVIVSF